MNTLLSELQLIWTNVSNKQLCHFLRYPCINVEVMTQKSSIYYQFINWPSSVFSFLLLIFHLPKQIFQMNNCVILFWKSCKKGKTCGPDKSGRTHDAHLPKWICNSYVSLTARSCFALWQYKADLNATIWTLYEHWGSGPSVPDAEVTTNEWSLH